VSLFIPSNGWAQPVYKIVDAKTQNFL